MPRRITAAFGSLESVNGRAQPFSWLDLFRGVASSGVEVTEHIYAQDSDRESNTVEVFIARLRRKLGASAIETVRGLGYRMGAAS